jgi:hypothetical protein
MAAAAAAAINKMGKLILFLSAKNNSYNLLKSNRIVN